jgi:hypothetical protein
MMKGRRRKKKTFKRRQADWMDDGKAQSKKIHTPDAVDAKNV